MPFFVHDRIDTYHEQKQQTKDFPQDGDSIIGIKSVKRQISR